MKNLFLLIFIFNIKGFTQINQPNPDSLYHHFTKAYDVLDAEKIGKLYTENAETLNLYDGGNANSNKGRAAIHQYFQKFFENTKSQNQKLVLTFKIVDRKKEGEYLLDNGFYRLEITRPNKPTLFGFGKFSTVLALENGQWKFKTDATTNTDFEEYENAIAGTIPIREELLYPKFYDELLGNFKNEKNEIIVIGRSQSRLYVYFEKSKEYRGLHKINSDTYSFGNTIISKDEKQTLKFNGNKIELYEKEKLISTAIKNQNYKTEKVIYPNKKGINLGGTLFIPQKSNGKAIVLIHGSGPQDRNGYASIIRLMADRLASNGTSVLTYDKQGVGQSEGNYEFMNFAELAQDALAGIDFLKNKKELKLTKIGLGGSSQAGWIIAKAIEQSNNVDFALTIGAGGSGISVIEQNIYNTEIGMKCLGTYSETQINNAITQQRYFFDYLNDQNNANKLDEFTKSLEKDTLVRDWLFPTSNLIDLTNRNQWFTALEIAFDPLPIWKNYPKPVLMTFSEFDDSTPSKTVKSKVDQLKKPNIQTILFPKAQHLGLVTDDICKNEIGELNKFHGDFFKTILKWLATI